jgi:hypothetical protein
LDVAGAVELAGVGVFEAPTGWTAPAAGALDVGLGLSALCAVVVVVLAAACVPSDPCATGCVLTVTFAETGSLVVSLVVDPAGEPVSVPLVLVDPETLALTGPAEIDTGGTPESRGVEIVTDMPPLPLDAEDSEDPAPFEASVEEELELLEPICIPSRLAERATSARLSIISMLAMSAQAARCFDGDDPLRALLMAQTPCLVDS